MCTTITYNYDLHGNRRSYSSSLTSNQNRMKEYLCLQVFDEQVEDLFDEDKVKANEIYQRLSSKWLAEIRIPFYTIYGMQRVGLKIHTVPCNKQLISFVLAYFQIEGIFEMTTPNILLGYAKQPVVWPDSSVERAPQIRSSVYLTISISLEPLFDPVELTTSNLECTELSDVKVC